MKPILCLALLIGGLCSLSGCDSSAAAATDESTVWSAQDAREALDALREVRQQSEKIDHLNTQVTATLGELVQQQDTLARETRQALDALKLSTEGVEQRLDNFPTTETDRARVSASAADSPPVLKTVCGPNGCYQVAQATGFNLFGGDTFTDQTPPPPPAPDQEIAQVTPANVCPGPNCVAGCTGGNCRSVSKTVHVSQAGPVSSSQVTRSVSVSGWRPVAACRNGVCRTRHRIRHR